MGEFQNKLHKIKKIKMQYLVINKKSLNLIKVFDSIFDLSY